MKIVDVLAARSFKDGERIITQVSSFDLHRFCFNKSGVGFDFDGVCVCRATRPTVSTLWNQAK